MPVPKVWNQTEKKLSYSGSSPNNREATDEIMTIIIVQMNKNFITSPAMLINMRSMGPNSRVSYSISKNRVHIKTTMTARKGIILNSPERFLIKTCHVYLSGILE